MPTHSALTLRIFTTVLGALAYFPATLHAGYITPGYTPTSCTTTNPVCKYINGNSPNTTMNGLDSNGYTVSGAYINPYWDDPALSAAQDEPVPSSFSGNFVVMGDGTFQSDPLAFSTIPRVINSLTGEIFFMFVYDSQETQQGASLQLEHIRLLINGQAVWTMTDVAVLNTAADRSLHTLTPLGNGADLALFVPVYLFNNIQISGRNLLGSDTFVFEVTESLNHNGNDEWRLVSSFTGVTFFTPTDTIYSPGPPPAVPEPGYLAAFPLGWLAYAWRRRNRQPRIARRRATLRG